MIDEELHEALEKLGKPSAVTREMLKPLFSELGQWWLFTKHGSRRINIYLKREGYIPTMNPNTTDGRWKINGMNVRIYGPLALSEEEREAAARELIRALRRP